MSVFGQCPQHAAVKRQKSQFVLRSLARRQEIGAAIRAERPIAVLAAAVDALKRLFVEDDLQVMPFGDLLHHNHQQHILVYGLRDFTEERDALELPRSDLVMPGLQWNAKPICLRFEILHESNHARRDGPEIMVLQLLVLSRCMANHGATTELQIRPCVIKSLIHQKIFLFQANFDLYRLDSGFE